MENKRGGKRVAVALGFEPPVDEAPRLLASGSGRLAEEILRVAQSHQKPVFENPQLAEILNQMPVGSRIPENLYRAVAAIFAHILQLDQDSGESKERTPGDNVFREEV